MPTTEIVKYRQTPIDIAIQYLGDAERLSELCKLNGIDPTTDLMPGQEVVVPAIDTRKKNIAAVFARRKITPASALQDIATNLDQLDWDVFYGIYG
jgi:hypothetical protein